MKNGRRNKRRPNPSHEERAEINRRASQDFRDLADEIHKMLVGGCSVAMGHKVGKTEIVKAVAEQLEKELNTPSVFLSSAAVARKTESVGHCMPFQNLVKFWMRPKKFSAPYPKETLAELERLWEPDKEN